MKELATCDDTYSEVICDVAYSEVVEGETVHPDEGKVQTKEEDAEVTQPEDLVSHDILFATVDNEAEGKDEEKIAQANEDKAEIAQAVNLSSRDFILYEQVDKDTDTIHVVSENIAIRERLEKLLCSYDMDAGPELTTQELVAKLELLLDAHGVQSSDAQEDVGELRESLVETKMQCAQLEFDKEELRSEVRKLSKKISSIGEGSFDAAERLAASQAKLADSQALNAKLRAENENLLRSVSEIMHLKVELSEARNALRMQGE